MTLLFMDSAQGGDPGTKWNVTSYGIRGTSTPRFAGGAWYAANASLIKSITPSSEVFVGAAFLYGGAGAYSSLSLSSDSGATMHLTIFRNAIGLMEVRRGSTAGTLLATGTNPIPASWTHVQVRATIADSGGIVQVRLNGSAANEIDYLGDTRNGGTSTSIDTVGFSVTTTSLWGVTDVVILNTAGTVNNTWPGDCQVVALTPIGNGATSQGVNSAGNSTNNYTHVDELPYSGADYVGVTPGNGDTYLMSDLPAGTTAVFAVQINVSLAKSDTGVMSAKRRLRSGGTTTTGPTVLLGTTYVTVSEILETDPATGTAWTISGVNAVEAGFEGA